MTQVCTPYEYETPGEGEEIDPIVEPIVRLLDEDGLA